MAYVLAQAEELPDPKRDMPKAILAQMALGTVTTFLYAISILYAINDLTGVVTSNGSFPLAEVYAQATGNAGGTFGLLLLLLLSIMPSVVGTFLTVSLISSAHLEFAAVAPARGAHKNCRRKGTVESCYAN